MMSSDADKRRSKSAWRTVNMRGFSLTSVWRLGCSGNWLEVVLCVHASDTSREQGLHEERRARTHKSKTPKKRPRKMARHTSTVAVNQPSFRLENAAPLPWCAAATLTSGAATLAGHVTPSSHVSRRLPVHLHIGTSRCSLLTGYPRRWDRVSCWTNLTHT
jgi:hypothetical protein